MLWIFALLSLVCAGGFTVSFDTGDVSSTSTISSVNVTASNYITGDTCVCGDLGVETVSAASMLFGTLVDAQSPEGGSTLVYNASSPEVVSTIECIYTAGTASQCTNTGFFDGTWASYVSTHDADAESTIGTCGNGLAFPCLYSTGQLELLSHSEDGERAGVLWATAVTIPGGSNVSSILFPSFKVGWGPASVARDARFKYYASESPITFAGTSPILTVPITSVTAYQVSTDVAVAPTSPQYSVDWLEIQGPSFFWTTADSMPRWTTNSDIAEVKEVSTVYLGLAITLTTTSPDISSETYAFPTTGLVVIVPPPDYNASANTGSGVSVDSETGILVHATSHRQDGDLLTVNGGGSVSSLTVGQLSVASDRNVKFQVEEIAPDEALWVITSLRPVKFRYWPAWLASQGREIDYTVNVGLIAQEVQEVRDTLVRVVQLARPVPALVGGRPSEISQFHSIDPSQIQSLLVGAVKALSADVAELAASIGASSTATSLDVADARDPLWTTTGRERNLTNASALEVVAACVVMTTECPGYTMTPTTFDEEEPLAWVGVTATCGTPLLPCMHHSGYQTERRDTTHQAMMYAKIHTGGEAVSEVVLPSVAVAPGPDVVSFRVRSYITAEPPTFTTAPAGETDLFVPGDLVVGLTGAPSVAPGAQWITVPGRVVNTTGAVLNDTYTYVGFVVTFSTPLSNSHRGLRHPIFAQPLEHAVVRTTNSTYTPGRGAFFSAEYSVLGGRAPLGRSTATVHGVITAGEIVSTTRVSSSDARIKTEITAANATASRELFRALAFKTYKIDPCSAQSLGATSNFFNGTRLGLIAQEVCSVSSDMCAYDSTKRFVDINGEHQIGFYGIKQEQISNVVASAAQQMDAELQEARAQIAALQETQASILARLDTLEGAR